MNCFHFGSLLQWLCVWPGSHSSMLRFPGASESFSYFMCTLRNIHRIRFFPNVQPAQSEVWEINFDQNHLWQGPGLQTICHWPATHNLALKTNQCYTCLCSLGWLWHHEKWELFSKSSSYMYTGGLRAFQFSPYVCFDFPSHARSRGLHWLDFDCKDVLTGLWVFSASWRNKKPEGVTACPPPPLCQIFSGKQQFVCCHGQRLDDVVMKGQQEVL